MAATKTRRAHTFPLKLSDRTVMLRRVDLMNQFLLGNMEQSLVEEVYATEQIFVSLDTKVSTMEAIAALAPKERRALLDGLRRFACIAVVSPAVMFGDEVPIEAISVEELGFADLMAIWNAKAPAAVAPDPNQPIALPATEGGEKTRFSEATAVAEQAEPVRDHPGGVGRTGEAVDLSPQRTPHRGLVNLTTH